MRGKDCRGTEQDRYSLLSRAFRRVGKILNKNVLSNYMAKKENEEHSRQKK